MSSTIKIVKNSLILLIVTVVSVSAQFSIPAIEIQATSPLGFRVALLDVPGIKLFGFHGKINSQINGKNTGDINGDVTSPKNGRWIFEDSNIQLNVGDTIYYWIFVQHDGFGYRKEDQVYTVTKLVPPNTPWSLKPSKKPSPTTNPTKGTSCADPSITTINDGKPVCKGKVIFEEKFNEPLNKSKWITENRLPDDDQENEFVSYQPKSVTLVSGKLRITPYLLHKISPSITQDNITYNGILDLTKGCTSSVDNHCMHEVSGYDILPPVVSGKITTRNLFSFKYGRIDIRAKLPQGDWIYPELYLESSRQRYGTDDPYESGQMRVAFSRGNRELRTDTEVLDNSVLSGGIMLGLTPDCRTAGMKTFSRDDVKWGDDYHTYTLIWTAESIEMLVDNESYGSVVPGFKDIYKNSGVCPSLANISQRWSAGTKMAPYDQEFYLAIGLGVGGIADFPDGVGEKTWKNKSKKSKYDFFNFASTWSDMLDDNKSLLVDSIKVTAI